MQRRRFLAGLVGASVVSRAADAAPYPLFYTDAAPFLAALTSARDAPLAQRITGLTVPHHLLAADLIAQAFRLASAGRYRRLVLISPDHFKRSTSPFATTTRRFITPLGAVPTDTDAALALTRQGPMVTESSLFSHEHGVQAILPFAAHFFPDVPVLAVACGIRTTMAEWRLLAAALHPLLGDDTLLVQSTDFSHYLSAGDAARRDAETLRVLSAGDPSGIGDLRQPDHIDSLAAMWLQMTLQPARWRAHGTVIQNRNAIHYGGDPANPRTTSYVSMLWSPDLVPASALPGHAWFLAGDTHFGRSIGSRLADPAAAARIVDEVHRITGGAPLIANLEGVIIDRLPARRPGKWEIVMESELTLAWLKRLGVTAVVLANNHTGDAGPLAYAAMQHLLNVAGIRAVGQGGVIDFPFFRLAGATDIDNTPSPRSRLMTRSMATAWDGPADARPLFAFLHGGNEYDPQPTARQEEMAALAESAGAALVTGCHPHRPSPGWTRTPRSLRLYSLGNFLFDQADPRNHGMLLEVRFFDQGTWAARLHRLPNLFEAIRR